MSTSDVDSRTPGVVMVTGGASGIGAAVVRHLASHRYTLVVLDIQDEAGVTVAEETNGTYLHHDVTRLEDWQANLAAAVDRHGSIYGLVNAAGIMTKYPFTEPDGYKFTQVVAVNQVGTALGTQVLGEHMRDNGRGSIVNISSAGAVPSTRSTDIAYVSSKWGVRGLSRVAAVALAPEGVRVNTVLPGITDTPMVRPQSDDPVPDRVALIANAIPMRRLAEPIDIARAVHFFISDLSAYCAGSELLVDGGLGA
ncbi:SDR family oxidoreductase [Actinomadura madurae]|uniref:SDR family NAD(P)-dependent oxidoreductase n=1 Tax=Actinomadura madurae TaxID=1993 RepID=UPI00399953E8